MNFDILLNVFIILHNFTLYYNLPVILIRYILIQTSQNWLRTVVSVIIVSVLIVLIKFTKIHGIVYYLNEPNLEIPQWIPSLNQLVCYHSNKLERSMHIMRRLILIGVLGAVAASALAAPKSSAVATAVLRPTTPTTVQLTTVPASATQNVPAIHQIHAQPRALLPVQTGSAATPPGNRSGSPQVALPISDHRCVG